MSGWRATAAVPAALLTWAAWLLEPADMGAAMKSKRLRFAHAVQAGSVARALQLT